MSIAYSNKVVGVSLNESSAKLKPNHYDDKWNEEKLLVCWAHG